MSKFASARVAALSVTASLLVFQPALADDEHHPDAPPVTRTMPGSQGMPDMMRMMQMMGMMGQSGSAGMSTMGMPMQMMTEHIEGRIAFLRAELKIAPAQTAAWDEFAEALRANAKRMSGMSGMAGQMGSATPTLSQRAAGEERLLEARLEGIRKMRGALDRLYAVLTDEQKKQAEGLMPPHLGMMPMGRM
jgi:hypothetical protein